MKAFRRFISRWSLKYASCSSFFKSLGLTFWLQISWPSLPKSRKKPRNSSMSWKLILTRFSLPRWEQASKSQCTRRQLTYFQPFHRWSTLWASCFRKSLPILLPNPKCPTSTLFWGEKRHISKPYYRHCSSHSIFLTTRGFSTQLFRWPGDASLKKKNCFRNSKSLRSS